MTGDSEVPGAVRQGDSRPPGSEELFRLAMEHSAIGMCLVAPDGAFLSVNPALCAMLGRDEAALTSATWQELTHPHDLRTDEALVADVIAGRRQSYRLLKRFVRPDHEVVWGDLSVASVRNGDGSVRYFVSQIVDVTATVTAREALAASEARYRILAENAADFVLRASPVGVIEWVSPSVVTAVGWRPDQMVGKHPWDFVPARDVRRTRRDAMLAVAGDLAPSRRQVRCVDGSDRWMSAEARPVANDSGAVVAVIMAFRDIQAEVEAQRLVEQSQRRFAAMFESHDAIMLLVEPDTGKIVDANVAAAAFYGYSRERLKTMSIGDINRLPGEEVSADRDDALNRRHNSFVFPHRLADGRVRTVEVHSSPIDDGRRTLLFSIIRDITDDLAARQALAAAEEQYRWIAENASDVVSRTTNEGIVDWVSPSVQALTGRTPGQMVGTFMITYIHPDDRPAVEAAQRELRRGRPQMFDARLSTADGDYRWIAFSVRPFTDESGAVSGRVAGWRDIHEEHQAREALAVSEQRFRLLAQNASDVVAMSAPDRTVAWVSPAVTRTLGWSTEDLVGTVLTDLIHPDDWAETEHYRERVYAGEEPAPSSAALVVRMRTKAGGYKWMSSTAEPVFAETGEGLGVVTGFRDVDDLVVARHQAQERQERLQATMDSLLDPSVLLQAVRDETGRIVDFTYADANAAACEYNRMTREELIGARLLDILPGQAGSGMLALYADAVESGQPLLLDDYSYPHEILQSERYYDIRAIRVGDALSFTWRDVTDRHQAVEALAASEEEYRLLAQNSSDVVVRGKDGRAQWVSPSVTDVLGWRPADWTSRPFGDFVHPEDQDLVAAFITDADSGGDRVIRLRVRARQGHYHWVDSHASPYVGPTGEQEGVVVSMRIVDAEVAADRELRRRAAYDSLTGLLNRNEAIDRMTTVFGREARSGDRNAVMFCDLDDFKSVNDTHGHAAGDSLLSTVAQRITSTVRDRDIVARMGGDEVLILLVGVHSLQEAHHVADKIRRSVAQPVEAAGTPITTTLSIGLTLVTPTDTVDSAIARADEAMYQAKQTGRDRVVTA
jgi:diguanylate cyclase (GGDEF)-like protein/PAS domain S-box-containing protein